MIPSGNPAIAAALISKKRKKIIAAFRVAGATSSSTAKTLAEIGLQESALLHIQKWRGIILKVAADRFYLDEVAEQRRRTLVIKLLLATTILVTVLVIYQWSKYQG
jgi:hypothetical protein